MKVDEMNATLRELFTKLIQQGYVKRQICSITLGDNFVPQFTNFLNGTDLGLGPITRMIENLGYELHLVPTSSNDSETQKVIQNKMNEFINNVDNDLVEFLNNNTRTPGKVSQSFSEEVNEIMDELIDNESSN